MGGGCRCSGDEGHEGKKGGRRGTGDEGHEGKEGGRSSDEGHEGEKGRGGARDEGHEGKEGGRSTSNEGHEGVRRSGERQRKLRCTCLPAHLVFGDRPTALTGRRGAKPPTFGVGCSSEGSSCTRRFGISCELG